MIEAILLLLGLVGILWMVALLGNLRKRMGELEQRVDALTASRAEEIPPPLRGPPPLESEGRTGVGPPPFLRGRGTVPRSGMVEGFLPEPEPSDEPEPPAERETPAQRETLAERETPAQRETLSALFERLVGGRLLVWTGAIAIALAGLFLVRYSIEIGLIGPATRMVAAAIFGLVLLAAGEIARRRFADDVRIGQALVGAGILVLYAAAYASHILYGLIGLGTAFALMALVAAAALALSLRHGPPAAVLGLVGGFLVPLLVGDARAGAAPLLGYLAILNLAVFAVARRTERLWLARAAQWLSLLWTASLLFPANAYSAVTGLFVLAHTVAASILLSGDKQRFAWAAPSFALLQLGLAVAIDHYAWTAWGCLLGLAAAAFVLRARGLARVPANALATALLLLATHATAMFQESPVGVVAALVTILFAGGAWWRLGNPARAQSAAIFCAAAAGPALVLRGVEASLLPPFAWGLLFAALALAPAALVWRVRGEARDEAPFAPALLLGGATAAVLLAAAAFDLAETLWLPLAWMLVALATLAAARRIGDGGLVRLSIVIGALATLAAAARAPMLWETLAASLVGVPVLTGGLPLPGTAAILFAGPATVAFALWLAMPRHELQLSRAAGAGAALLAALAAYVAYKQLFALADHTDFVTRGFAERTLLTQSLFFAGWLLARRPRRRRVQAAAFALTAAAAARFAWFDLAVLNPAAVTQNVGAIPVLNLIAPAYLASAFWLWEARRRAVDGRYATLFFALFLAALIAGAALLVRQLFQGAILTGSDLPRAEFYGYSLAGLLLSVALLLWGWRRGDTPLRVAGLALLTATVVKVFAVDASALRGLLRILSFLGLGIALIGMGKLYGTLLGRPKPS